MTANIELPNQPYFTPREVGEILRLDYRTILVWLKSPEHPLVGFQLHNKMWRIPRVNLIQYLEKEYGRQ